MNTDVSTQASRLNVMMRSLTSSTGLHRRVDQRTKPTEGCERSECAEGGGGKVYGNVYQMISKPTTHITHPRQTHY